MGLCFVFELCHNASKLWSLFLGMLNFLYELKMVQMAKLFNVTLLFHCFMMFTFTFFRSMRCNKLSKPWWARWIHKIINLAILLFPRVTHFHFQHHLQQFLTYPVLRLLLNAPIQSMHLQSSNWSEKREKWNRNSRAKEIW